MKRGVRFIGTAFVAVAVMVSTVFTSAAPVNAATSTRCGISGDWKHLSYSSTLTDNSLFHANVYYRNKADLKMQFCVYMVADKDPSGRLMRLQVSKPGTDINVKTTGGRLSSEFTLSQVPTAIVKMTFEYTNPARPDSTGRVVEEFALFNWR